MPATDKDILKNKVFALGGYRFSADANTFNLNLEAPSVDISSFEDPANRYRKGPLDGRITLGGGLTAKAEKKIVTDLAAAEAVCEPFTLFLESGALGSMAAFLEAEAFTWQRTGQRGSLIEFSSEIYGQGLLHLGKVLLNNVGGSALAATGSGTAIDLGVTLGAGQQLVSTLHVLNPPGVQGTSPTLDMVIESDADAGFAAPTVRQNFAQVTDEPAAELLVRDGDTDPITPHTFYRPRYTIGGSGVGYTVMMAIAIVTKP